MNRKLPPSIIVTAWAPVKNDFSARFSCSSRHYNYIFSSKGLNICKMNNAAKLMIGEHDFRNFSKAQLERQDTKRVCFDANVSEISDLPGMSVFSIKSSGFLYHQIRLTMSILALIGNELEDEGLVTELLNIEKYPRRPAYKFANPDGLVLVNCEYEGLKWVQSPNSSYSAKKVDDRLYSMKIALAVQKMIKSELHVEEDKRDMAHKKITGIAEKIGFHKKILDYDLSLNAADLLNKKDSS